MNLRIINNLWENRNAFVNRFFSNPYASDELSNAFKSWKTASLWHGLHGSRGRKLTTHHKQHCVDKTGWDSCHGYTCNLHHIIMHIYHLWGSFWLDTQALSASLTCMFAFHRHLLRDGLLCCTTETTRESGMQMAQMVLLPFISWHSQIFPAWAFYASIIARTWAPFPSNLLSECVSSLFGREAETRSSTTSTFSGVLPAGFSLPSGIDENRYFTVCKATLSRSFPFLCFLPAFLPLVSVDLRLPHRLRR